MRYFKGHDKNYRRTCYKVYDEPQEDFFGLHKHADDNDCYSVELHYLDGGSGYSKWADIATMEAEGFTFGREITEQEFEIYSELTTIINEIYMNQFTGGFPGMNTVHSAMARLRRNIDHFDLKDMSVREAMAQVLVNQAKASGLY